MQSKADGASPARTRVEPARGEVTRRPEVLDDFIRNVLLKMQMGETLRCSSASGTGCRRRAS